MLPFFPEIIFILFLLSFFFAFLFFRKRESYPYFACETLLTKAELKFFHILQAVVKDKYCISCKTRLADIIQCAEKNWHAGYGPKISAKHIDFVLFDPETSAIILCIELDDKSHNLPARQKRDHFINNALKVSNIPLLRIPVQKGYDMAFLDKEIKNSIQ